MANCTLCVLEARNSGSRILACILMACALTKADVIHSQEVNDLCSQVDAYHKFRP